MLCNEPKEIPSGTNPLPKADQLFLEKFCSRVDRSGGTTFGAASSLWKEDPHGARAGGMSHNFRAQAFPRKGCPKIKQGRSCLQRDSSAHYEPNRHKLLLSSHFSLERQFLPVASCPPPSPHTHVFQLCTADFNLELYVGWRLCLCNGWSRWEMHPNGSCVCAAASALFLMETGSSPSPSSHLNVLLFAPHRFVCPAQIPGWVVEHCRRGGRSLVLVHEAQGGAPLLIPFPMLSAGAAGLLSMETATTSS